MKKYTLADAEIEAKNGNSDEAQRILELAPSKDADVDRVQGLISFTRGQFDSAIESLDRSLAKEQDDSLKKLRDRAQKLKGDWEQIQKILSLGHEGDHQKVLQIAEGLLAESTDKIESGFRIQLQLAISETLLNIHEKRFKADPNDSSAGELEPIVNGQMKVLSQTGYLVDRMETRPDYRPFVISAILFVGRAHVALGDKFLARQAYERVYTFLKEGWQPDKRFNPQELEEECEREIQKWASEKPMKSLLNNPLHDFLMYGHRKSNK